MPNVIQTQFPLTKYVLKSIRPCFNDILHGFNTFQDGIQTISTGLINFSTVLGGGLDFSAVDGDYIEINGEKIYFRDNPRFGELTPSASSSRLQATQELYRILKINPTIKNQYLISIIADSPSYSHVLLVARQKTSLLDITLALSGAGNILLQTSPGLSTFYGGDTSDWSMFVELIALSDNDNRNLTNQNSISPTIPNESVMLEKFWAGLIDEQIDNSPEKSIIFNVSEFLKNFIKVLHPFDKGLTFFYQKDAIIRYIYIFGDKLNGNYREIDSEQFPMFAHFSQLPNSINPNSKLPLIAPVNSYYTNDLDAAFLPYWNRMILSSMDYNLIKFLTNYPTDYKIQLTQTLFLHFIYDYQRFDSGEFLGVPQDTDLIIEFDLYFEFGGSILGETMLDSFTVINYNTQLGIDVSLNRLDISNYETIAGSLLEKVVFRVMERLTGELIYRQVTENKSFTLDNEHRYYKNDSSDPEDVLNHNFGELIFLNALGGWDSVFSLSEVIENIQATNELYEKIRPYPNSDSVILDSKTVNDTVDFDVLSIDMNKTIDFQVEYCNKETHKYLLELLKSPVIYFRKVGDAQTWIRVAINSTNYQNNFNSDMQSFSIKLNVLLNENISK